MNFLIAAAIGLGAGVASGLFGIGGGIVIVPALMFFLGFQIQAATGTSLLALLLPVGILGVYKYYQNAYIDMSHVKVAAFIAFGILIGAYYGADIATHLKSDTLSRIFSIFLIIVAVRIWLTAK